MDGFLKYSSLKVSLDPPSLYFRFTKTEGEKPNEEIVLRWCDGRGQDCKYMITKQDHF